MKKIIIEARESGTSTGRYLDKLIEYLHSLNPEYEIIILTRPQRVSFMEKIAPNFMVVKSTYKEFTFAEQLGFKRQIDSLGADLVHFGLVQQPILYKGKVVTTMHDLTTTWEKNPSKNPLIFWIKQKVYIWVNKKVAHKSEAIIVPSHFVKKDVVQFSGVSASKITVTYESADKIEEPAKKAGKVKSPFIMYVGRPMPHKNLERLIEAFVLLQEQHPNLQLVLAGRLDSNYNRIKTMVENREISNIVFTDFVTEGQLKWLYQNCEAYIVPSLSEGFGLPGLEAMLHGAMVISSDATCLPEIYGDAALYFYPYHTKTISDTIHEGLTNTSLRKKIIAEGREQVKKYSWERMAQQTLELYKKVLGDT
ncbi:MAG TPA: glycosyltransferase family 1 protein [Candidatus Saccharimonadales bacterium]|nr:glycosyltransferase family 1 protein [Candidatus Saccharimonadales bacterium]